MAIKRKKHKEFFRMNLGAKFFIVIACVALATAAIMGLVSDYAIQRQNSESIKESLAQRAQVMLQLLQSKGGSLHVEEGALKAGLYVIDGNNEVVDSVAALYGGLCVSV